MYRKGYKVTFTFSDWKPSPCWWRMVYADRLLMVKCIQSAFHCLNMPSSQNTIQLKFPTFLRKALSIRFTASEHCLSDNILWKTSPVLTMMTMVWQNTLFCLLVGCPAAPLCSLVLFVGCLPWWHQAAPLCSLVLPGAPSAERDKD